jgi:hypothetical protein
MKAETHNQLQTQSLDATEAEGQETKGMSKKPPGFALTSSRAGGGEDFGDVKNVGGDEGGSSKMARSRHGDD